MACFSSVFSYKLSVGFKRKARYVPVHPADGKLELDIVSFLGWGGRAYTPLSTTLLLPQTCKE